MQRHRCLAKQIRQFKRLHQIGIPDQRTIADLHVLKGFPDFLELYYPLLHDVPGPKYGRMILHGPLHAAPDHGCRLTAICVSNPVEMRQARVTGIPRQRRLFHGRVKGVGTMFCCRAPKYDQIEQRIGSQAVGSMDRNTSSLTNRH